MDSIKRVIALGFFDGVHRGHGALLERTVSAAVQNGAVASVISFDVPPAKLTGGSPVPMITSNDDRKYIISRLYGIDDVIFLRFDEKLRNMEWHRFLTMLRNDFGAVHLVAGRDFRFGAGGRGDCTLLLSSCSELGIGCDIVDTVTENSVPICSSDIRKLIEDGNMEEAALLLGHSHFLTDTVRSGFHIGRTLGAPTINMLLSPGVLVPRYGVYASRATVLSNGTSFRAVTNIGVRPTVSNGSSVTVESHLFGFSGDLYGSRVMIEFLHFIRPEEKFAASDDLARAIKNDFESAQNYFDIHMI